MFTVLTRTSGRPNYFRYCRDSVLGQSEKVKHVINVDDDSSYARGDVICRQKLSDGTYPYNLYFNEMIKHAEGYVIHLDDDDEFTSPSALTILRNHIEQHGKGHIYLWRAKFGRKVIPDNFHFGKSPRYGHISGIAFCVHKDDWIDWKNKQGGDHDVISKYYTRLTPIWIDEVLTGLQNSSGRPGLTKRNDLPD